VEEFAITRRRAPAALLAIPPHLAAGPMSVPASPEVLPAEVVHRLDYTRAAIRRYALLEARETVETALEQVPDSFTVNAVHGEVLYRLGLYTEASAALFRALMIPPTSWRNYQVVNHLYQESRANERGSFVRNTECPPPRPVARLILALCRPFRGLARFRRLEATG
jgi:hypothetical protein